MTTLLAIDPDTKDGCACAYFVDGRLVRAAFEWLPGNADVSTIVVERMQADARTRDIDVGHLLDCQFAGAGAAFYALGLAGGNAELIHLTPTQWKGSESKPVQHARLFGVNSAMTGAPAVLDAREQAVLGGRATFDMIDRAVDKGAASRWSKPGAAYYPLSFVTHNLLDAAALGCFHLGRLKKR